MIGFIKGELAEIKENHVVLETINIGYEIFLPHRRFWSRSPERVR